MTEWLSRTTVYECRIFTVKSGRKLNAAGNPETFDVIEHHGGVGVVAFFPDLSVLLVRQHRAAADEFLLEIPAGKLEGAADDPVERARRELEEETGYRANRLELIADFYVSPAYCSERIRVYLGQDLVYVGEDPDDTETVEAVRLSLDDVRDMFARRQFRDAKTIIGLGELLATLDDRSSERNRSGGHQ